MRNALSQCGGGSLRNLAAMFGILFVVFAIACSEDSRVCSTSGETRECDCPNGVVGRQVCSADLFWGECRDTSTFPVVACTRTQSSGANTGGPSQGESPEANTGVPSQCEEGNPSEPRDDACYRCLNNDPWVTVCSETIERSDGSWGCIIGSDVLPCSTVADCCLAQGRKVSEGGGCSDEQAKLTGESCVDSDECLSGVCERFSGADQVCVGRCQNGMCPSGFDCQQCLCVPRR